MPGGPQDVKFSCLIDVFITLWSQKNEFGIIRFILYTGTVEKKLVLVPIQDILRWENPSYKDAEKVTYYLVKIVLKHFRFLVTSTIDRIEYLVHSVSFIPVGSSQRSIWFSYHNESSLKNNKAEF